MIYVPQLDYACYEVRDKDTIRAYNVTPSYGTSYNYKDFYINSNYLTKEGQGQWSNYSTLPSCISQADLTDNIYYRNDFDKIAIIFLLMFFIVIFLPFKLFQRFFRRLH